MPENYGHCCAERDGMISSGDPRVSATVVCMSDASISQFLRDHGIQDKGQLITLVQAVAAIPWGEARTVAEVLSKNKGTCTGKHLLLQMCLQELDIPFRPVVSTFRWERQKIDLPPHLRDLLKDHLWEHGHNFVQLKGEGDSWIDVDVTWDPQLQRYGFRTLPKDWNGTTSFVGLDVLEKRFDGADIGTMKEKLIEGLTPEQRKARAEFLEKFIEWIDSLRP